MAANIRNFSCLLKINFSRTWMSNKLLLSSLGNKSEVLGLFKRFSTVIQTQNVGVEGRSLSRPYHMSQTLGVKASQLSKEIPLEKADVGCPICSANITFSYKDVLFLSQFLSPEGNLLNKRITGVCGKQQRKLEKAIKISRRLGLLPKCGPVNVTEANHS